MINDPTRISDTYSSCIDLIFTTQPKLVVESGVRLSSHPDCHHQIIFAKYNLKIHYPPPYFRQVSDYQEGDTKLIRRVIDLFDWKKAFENTYLDEKVAIFNKAIYNFIPHKLLVVYDKDPPWHTNKIKNLSEKNIFSAFLSK